MSSAVGDAGDLSPLGAPPLVDEVPLERRLHRQVWSDLRWAFRPPWNWLAGVVFNLVLAALFLLVDPLQVGPHRSWAVIVGTYFAVFVLADVTTTNVLGADAIRVSRGLAGEIPLRRILLVKNLTLLIIVGLPMLMLTGAIALASQPPWTVLMTMLGVLFPIFTWVGIGNLVSVALPVAALPLKLRWKRRRDLWRTARWGIALALPYVLYSVVSPVSFLPRLIDQAFFDHARNPVLRTVTMVLTGVALWALGSVLALTIARRRAVRFDDLPEVWPQVLPWRVEVTLWIAEFIHVRRWVRIILGRRRASRRP